MLWSLGSDFNTFTNNKRSVNYTFQTDDYSKYVLPLIVISNVTQDSSGDHFIGSITISRHNGIGYNHSYPYMMVYDHHELVNPVFEYSIMNTDSESELINVTRPCKFKYNNIWFAGLEIITTDGKQITLQGTVLSGMNVGNGLAPLKYATNPASGSPSIIISEINSSINITNIEKFYSHIEAFDNGTLKNTLRITRQEKEEYTKLQLDHHALRFSSAGDGTDSYYFNWAKQYPVTSLDADDFLISCSRCDTFAFQCTNGLFSLYIMNVNFGVIDADTPIYQLPTELAPSRWVFMTGWDYYNTNPVYLYVRNDGMICIRKSSSLIYLTGHYFLLADY